MSPVHCRMQSARGHGPHRPTSRVKRTAPLGSSQRTDTHDTAAARSTEGRVCARFSPRAHGLGEDAGVTIAIETPPNRSAGRPRHARRLRPGPPPAQGAARDCPGAGRRSIGPIPGHRPRRGRAQRLSERVPRSAGVPLHPPRPGRRPAAAVRRRTGKTIVEHTAINPNKAAHIGHLRNAALGDTLVRVLRFRGTPVEVQNYIDDTGVQVADVVVGFQALEPKSLAEVQALADDRRGSTTTAGTSTPASPSGTSRTRSASTIRADALHAIEHGDRAGRLDGAPSSPIASSAAT